MENVYEVEYAGKPIRYSFRLPLTRYYFREYIRKSPEEGYDIRVSDELFAKGRAVLPDEMSDASVEYRLLISLTIEKLLERDCCLFHSVAFVYEGRAWLLTAPSGTGKTTQFLNWQRAFPGEIEMICGDMPVLALRDGAVSVHSCSWCGKENLGRKGLSAPLAGVVLLEQAELNELQPMEPHDALYPFFAQMLVHPETEEQIMGLARIMDCMLAKYPLMRFRNLGDDASTAMLRDAIRRIGEERSRQ